MYTTCEEKLHFSTHNISKAKKFSSIYLQLTIVYIKIKLK